MTPRTPMKPSLAGGMLLAAAVGLLAIPLWPDAPQSANRKLEDRIEAMEKKLERTADRAQGAEAKVVNLETVVDELRRKISRMEPEASHWIKLDHGTGQKWFFDSGEEAQLEFLDMTEDGTGTQLRVKHETLQADVVLRPGETMEAIDDRGTERIVYRTSLHSIRRDRNGKARMGLISVARSVESGL